MSCTQLLHGQDWRLLKSIPIQHPVVFMDSDVRQRLYTVNTEGELSQFDHGGETIANFGTAPFGNPSHLQVRGLRTFLFFENTQQFIFLNQFLSHRGEIHTIPESVGYVRLATLSNDNHIWLLDDQELNLLKFNLEYQQIIMENALINLFAHADLHPYLVEEYQNRLYIGDRHQGVLVSDILGKYLKTIKVPGDVDFNFTKEYLYFLLDSQIHFYHLYHDTRFTLPLPDGKNYSHVNIMGDHLWLCSKEFMDLFRIKYPDKY